MLFDFPLFAYVGVTYSENGYSYYFISEDGSGQGLPILTNKVLVDEGTDHFYTSHTDEGATSAALASALHTEYAKNANVIKTGSEGDNALVAPYTALATAVQSAETGKTISKIVFINKPASGNCHYEKAN